MHPLDKRLYFEVLNIFLANKEYKQTNKHVREISANQTLTLGPQDKGARGSSLRSRAFYFNFFTLEFLLRVVDGFGSAYD